MKNRYSLEILRYDGHSKYHSLEADKALFEEGVIKFVKDGGDEWIPIAVYPSDKTIISKIEKLNK